MSDQKPDSKGKAIENAPEGSNVDDGRGKGKAIELEPTVTSLSGPPRLTTNRTWPRESEWVFAPKWFDPMSGALDGKLLPSEGSAEFNWRSIIPRSIVSLGLQVLEQGSSNYYAIAPGLTNDGDLVFKTVYTKRNLAPYTKRTNDTFEWLLPEDYELPGFEEAAKEATEYYKRYCELSGQKILSDSQKSICEWSAVLAQNIQTVVNEHRGENNPIKVIIVTEDDINELCTRTPYQSEDPIVRIKDKKHLVPSEFLRGQQKDHYGRAKSGLPNPAQSHFTVSSSFTKSGKPSVKTLFVAPPRTEDLDRVPSYVWEILGNGAPSQARAPETDLQGSSSANPVSLHDQWNEHIEKAVQAFETFDRDPYRNWSLSQSLNLTGLSWDEVRHSRRSELLDPWVASELQGFIKDLQEGRKEHGLAPSISTMQPWTIKDNNWVDVASLCGPPQDAGDIIDEIARRAQESASTSYAPAIDYVEAPPAYNEIAGDELLAGAGPSTLAVPTAISATRAPSDVNISGERRLGTQDDVESAELLAEVQRLREGVSNSQISYTQAGATTRNKQSKWKTLLCFAQKDGSS